MNKPICYESPWLKPSSVRIDHKDRTHWTLSIFSCNVTSYNKNIIQIQSYFDLIAEKIISLRLLWSFPKILLTIVILIVYPMVEKQKDLKKAKYHNEHPWWPHCIKIRPFQSTTDILQSNYYLVTRKISYVLVFSFLHDIA